MWRIIGWMVCVGAISTAAWQGYQIFERRAGTPMWQHIQTVEGIDSHLVAYVQKLQQSYNQGEIATLSELAEHMRQHPLTKEVRFSRTLAGIQLQYTPFTPFAILNDQFYLSYSGEIKALLPNYAYNPQLRIVISEEQLKQYFPNIRQLSKKVQTEALEARLIRITKSATWTVEVANGWTLIFGPDPDFDQLFDDLRMALPQIFQRGRPMIFDFRYDRAIAVTFAS